MRPTVLLGSVFRSTSKVEDVVISSDGRLALSGGWNKEFRLLDLATATCIRRFVGHTEDVLSLDNQQIVSASDDGTIKLWNTLGECKHTISKGGGEGHNDWVHCVRFSPVTVQPTIVSASWDTTVKVWNLPDCRLRSTIAGHTGPVTTVAVSPDNSVWASAGKDGSILVWQLAEGNQVLSLEAGSVIHTLCFKPNSSNLLCAATEDGIQIWDLATQSIVQSLNVDPFNVDFDAMVRGQGYVLIYCTSLNWSVDGSTLFGGYTDGLIRVWGIGSS